MKRFEEKVTLPAALTQGGIEEKHIDNFHSLPIFFYISKTQNNNIVTYRANFTDTGTLDQENPLSPTWIMYTKGENSKTGHIYEEGITFFERKFYGVTVHEKSVDAVTVYINALGSKYLISLSNKGDKSLSAKITHEDKNFEFLNAHVTLNSLGISVRKVMAKLRDPESGEIIEQEVKNKYKSY
eukprot:snap_masked-scaffold_69-processed-gene-0.23-mRNA-1 protein AED:0.09 eAED:1.00 QI:0/0/0/1/1/1/2/0/183